LASVVDGNQAVGGVPFVGVGAVVEEVSGEVVRQAPDGGAVGGDIGGFAGDVGVGVGGGDVDRVGACGEGDIGTPAIPEAARIAPNAGGLAFHIDGRGFVDGALKAHHARSSG